MGIASVLHGYVYMGREVLRMGKVVKISKTCVKQLLSKRQKIGFQHQLSLNAGQTGAFCNTFDLH